jgi:hypothetical protein
MSRAAARRISAREAATTKPDPAPVAAPPSADGVRTILLRRMGARPLRFQGRLLAAAEAATWHAGPSLRLALYACGDLAYAVAMCCEPAIEADAALAWHRAELCPTLEHAIAAFETGEPLYGDAATLPERPGEALLHAATRVCRQAALRSAYGNAVGAFLHRLCLEGSAFDR